MHALWSHFFVLTFYVTPLIQMVKGQSDKLYLKLLEEETFEINMQQLLQDYSDSISVEVDSWPEYPVDKNIYSLTDNWFEQFSILESNISNECALLDDSIFKYFAYNFTSRMISRVVKVKDNSMYISTSYHNYQSKDLNDQPVTYNKLETVVFDFNTTHISFSRKLPDRDFVLPPAYNAIPNLEVIRFQHQYIATYKESVNLVMEKDSEGCVLRFQRPQFNINITLGYFKNDSLRSVPFDLMKKPTSIEMKLFTVELGSFEVWVYSPAFPQVFNFILTKDNIMDLRVTTFAYNWTSIHYIASCFMIFVHRNDSAKAGDSAETLYYLERYPGSKVESRKVALLGEFSFLNGFASNEANEIIIEAYQSMFVPSHMVNIKYSVFSYNLNTKIAAQTQTIVLFVSAKESNKMGNLLRLDTFWLQETILFLTSTRVYQYNESAVPPASRISATSDRLGLWVLRDPYLGFGCSAYIDRNNNLYNMGTYRDLKTNQYLMLPFGNLFNQKDISKFCHVLKVRVKEYLLRIKCKPVGSSCHPWLFVKMSDSSKVVFRNYFISFHKNDDPSLKARLWPATNSTTFTSMTSKQYMTMRLNDVIRGSYVVHYLNEKNSHLNYPELSDETLSSLQSKSMFRMKYCRFPADLANKLTSFNFLIGLEVQTENKMPYILLLASPTGFNKLLILRLEGNYLERYVEVPTMTTIVKTLTVAINEYLFFMADGSFEYFKAETLEFSILPYPGVNCLDIQLLFHPHIKPSILCYTINRSFSVYYLDELVTKSLSNSQIRFEQTYFSRLKKYSRLMTSSAYPGFFFVFTRRSKSQFASLSVYFVDVEEKYEITQMKEVNLEKVFPEYGGYNVTSVVLIKDRFVVHFRSYLNSNIFGFFRFTENLEIVVLKKAVLSPSVSINATARIFHFGRAFSSLLYENTDPLLCIQIHNSTVPNEKNVLVIDPFSPALETFPTVILPRNSISEQFALFPLYSFGSDKLRKSSIGILHFDPEQFYNTIQEYEKNFLFQFFEPNQPTIYFDVASSDKFTPDLIISSNYKGGITNASIALEDYLEMSNPNSRFNFTMNFQVSNNSIHEDTDKKSNFKNQDVDRSLKYETFKKKKQTVVYDSKFTNLLTRTVINWEFDEESIFDKILKTMDTNPPLKIIGWKNSLNWTSLNDLDNFCYRFKEAGNGKYKCSEFGRIFYFQNKIGIYYGKSVTDLTSKDVFFIDLQWSECTGYFMISYMLMTICKTEASKSLVITNMMTLEQIYYNDPSFTGLNWKQTDFIKLSSEAIAFIRINQKNRDLLNRMAVGGSVSFLFNDNFQNPTQFLYFNRMIGKVGKKVYDMYSGFMTMIHYFQQNNSYLVTQMAIYTGNNIAFILEVQFLQFLKLAPRNWTDKIFETETFLAGSNIQENIRFTFSGSKDMKQAALANAYLKVLAFDNKDYIFTGIKENIDELNKPNEEPIFSNFLAYFPNYHSFIFRFRNYFKMCSLEIYKLFNPFAGFENTYHNQRPDCRGWACIVTFRALNGINFAILYDMKYEWIRERNRSNFAEIFNSTQNFECDKIPDPQINFNLTSIGLNYTIYPLQVLRIDNLQHIVFDKDYSNEDDPDEFMAIVFYKNTTSAQLIVNRKLKVVMKNLYVSSNFIEAKVTQLYGVSQEMQLIIVPFYEVDYYKYYVFMLGCLILAGIYKACAYLSLKKQEDQRIKDFEDEFRKDNSRLTFRRKTHCKPKVENEEKSTNEPENSSSTEVVVKENPSE